MRSQPQLLLLNPRQHAHEQDDRTYNDRPESDMQHVHVKRCLRGGRHCRKAQDHDGIPADPVVLVRRLCALHASQQSGGVEGDSTDQRLEGEEDVDAQPESAVDGREVGAVVGGFVVDDHGEAGQEG